MRHIRRTGGGEGPPELADGLGPLYCQARPELCLEGRRAAPAEGYTTYVVDLKSQSWPTEQDVDRTLWEHWLTIVKPDRVDIAEGLSVHQRRQQQKGAGGTQERQRNDQQAGRGQRLGRRPRI